jgi:ATP/maltotriose-dependent transcriptional regulator MalT
MARYDRIAALPLPARDQAIPCWPVLRELQGRERENEIANRARLYFIVLRPARRLLDLRFVVPEESHDRQIAAVRAEVESLPASSPDRGRLRAYLSALATRQPDRACAATLDIAVLAESRSHYEAAEEFALTALGMAELAHTDAEVRALTVLARLARLTGRWDEAEERGKRAVDLAAKAAARSAWANAVTELATLHHARRERDAAAELLAAVRRRVAEWKEEPLVADAAEALATTALAARLPEVAVHEGWFALHRISDQDRRRRLLLSIASGLRALDLVEGAEACYTAVAQSAPGPLERAHALVENAALAAYAGRGDRFRERHDSAVRELNALPPTQRAPLLVALGSACLLAGDTARAEAYGTNAQELARTADVAAIAGAAAELLASSRAHASGVIIADVRTVDAPADDTRDLSDEIAGSARRVLALRA